VALALACWVVGRRPLRRPLAAIAGAGWVLSAFVAIVVHGSLRREEFGTDIRLAEFAAGVLLAVGMSPVRRFIVDRRPLADAFGMTATVGFVVLVALAARDDAWLASGGYALLSLLWVVWLVAALQGRWMPRLLELRPLVWLGTISYSLYLVHWPIVLMLKDDRLESGRWTGIAVRVAVSLVVAVALHHAVERPLRRIVAERATGQVLVGWLAGASAVTVLALALLQG
jgi:peptidoglycan/LPS O-acetylase OafA/YrhL